MEFETLEIQRDRDVATIILNRPDVHNAMNENMMRELTSCFKEFSRDEEIRIIILTGRGKSFCAGADLNWMKRMVNYSMEENIEDSNLLLELYDSIYYCSKPVIAKVNGHAFGGGIGLFATCDIAIAVPNCKFAFSEVKLGIIPAVISTFVARRLSIAEMRRLFITGERFTSEYAEKIGLIDLVVPEEEIDDKVNQYVSILKSSGPKAIMEVKNLLDQYEKLPSKDYKEYTVRKISELRVSEEGQEGINAFLEKRKPRWSE
ncbi:MAG TPA: enoyl-CoA hydratase/isomerase family protein [Thermoplasmatales archaeon]|nr:enoyl-CoA hydratase/isomerase family protein [Thermoplasmatales archaeon]